MGVRERAEAIREATPRCLAELYSRQEGICDLCGCPIQDVILAELDHSIPVLWFAKSDLALGEAIQLATNKDNLKAVHERCNVLKGTLTRTEWFQHGLNHRPAPRQRTTEELNTFRQQLSAGGCKTKKLKLGWFAPGMASKAGALGGSIGGKKGGAVSASIQKARGTGIFSIGGYSEAGKIGAAITNHKRWHVHRSLTNPHCELCQKIKLGNLSAAQLVLLRHSITSA